MLVEKSFFFLKNNLLFLIFKEFSNASPLMDSAPSAELQK